MSSMAKIFVVVNLLLVTAVWGSAATLLGAQDDYRKSLAKTAEAAQAKQTQLEGEVKAADGRAAGATQKATEMNLRAEEADTRRVQAETGLDKATQINQQLTAANERMTAELEALRKQIETQQATVTAAVNGQKEANAKFQDAHKKLEEESRNRAALEARVQELDDSVRSLQADNQDKDNKIREKDFWIAKAKEQGFDIKSGPQPSGRVLEVREVAGGGMIVILSVGSKDGVQMGTEYKLRRGSKFVGFARVTRVNADTAVAMFDTQNTGSGAPPQSQDEAYVD